MSGRDLKALNVKLKDMFGWRVEVSPQRSEYEAPGLHLKLYRIANPSQAGSKNLYLGPMPICMPDYAIENAGWLCGTYYQLGYEQGRRDERKLRRGRKRTRKVQ